MKPLRLALAGLGTVGCGTARLLQSNAALISARAGRPVTLVAVSARDKTKERDLDLSAIRWVEDPLALPDQPDVDAVVELIGGAEGPARALAIKTLEAGKPLVTANKALLAAHGVMLASLAEDKKVPLLFEASVGGGIPVIKTMREALAGNKIAAVQGIMNGTCNYILTRMQRAKLSFEDALAEAQKLGYAEPDPSADVDGHDTAHKLVVLAALAFGMKPDLASVTIEGLRKVTQLDLQFAAELDCRIKLLGVARRTAQGVEQRVSPCLVPLSSPLAEVDDVLNAIQIEGDAVGPLALVGRGAGANATASAVVGDLIDLARATAVCPWGVPVADLPALPVTGPEDRVGRWYIRLQATDKAGVLAGIATILKNEGISVESLLQHGRAAHEGVSVPLIIVTHLVDEACMRRALAKIGALDSIWDEPFCLRMEDYAA